MKLYRIGQISKLYDVSVDTLRHYEKIGLLEPEYVKDNGYRYYSNRQIWKLNVIRTLRHLDIGLLDIKDHLVDRTIGKSESLIELQLEAIEQQQAELQGLKQDLQLRKKHLVTTKKTPCDMEIELKTLPERKCWVNKKQATSFWDVDRLHKEIEANHFGEETRYTGFGNAGARIAHQHFDAGKYGIYSESFILDEAGDHTLEGGQHLCLNFWGHDDMEDIKRHYDRVKVYMAENGLAMNGPAIELYKIDIHETDNPDEFLTELQVPVRLQ